MDKYYNIMFLKNQIKLFPQVAEIYNKKISKINLDVNVKNGLACICSQELSRKVLDWPLIYITTVNVPIPLQPHQYIAGGSVLNILTRDKIKDYDVFLAGDFDIKLDNLINLSKTCNAETSLYAITIKSLSSAMKEYFIENKVDIHKIPIQIIKRIYSHFSHIIGGFDLDACRFIMNHKGEIYTTYTGLYSLITKNMSINIYCQSSNFPSRIRKYKRRGFHALHYFSYSGLFQNIFSNTYDYFPEYNYKNREYNNLELFESVFNYDAKTAKTKLMLALNNLKHIINNNTEYCIISNNEVNLQEMLWILKRISWDSLKVKKHCFKAAKSHKLYKNIVIDYYNKRSQIQNYFEIKKPVSQFTGSFKPTLFTAMQMYTEPINIDFLIIFPELKIIYACLRKKIVIKNIITLILINYFNALIKTSWSANKDF